jgi:hypothetical protein
VADADRLNSWRLTLVDRPPRLVELTLHGTGRRLAPTAAPVDCRVKLGYARAPTFDGRFLRLTSK